MPVLDSLLIVVLLLNLFVLGTSRIYAVIRAVSVQGALLGFMPLLVHERIGIQTAFLSAATVLLKGIVIPRMLMHAMREARIRREVEPFIGLLTSMVLGAVAAGVSVLAARELPLAAGHAASLVVPSALATSFTGFILLVTRLKAISQVTGFLLLENGIFIFALLLLEAMPFIVEIGVLLDLFVGIFLIGIIVEHMNREFSSLDTRHLTTLKE